MNNKETIKSRSGKKKTFEIDFEYMKVNLMLESETIIIIDLHDVVNLAQVYFKRRKLENAQSDYELELSELKK